MRVLGFRPIEEFVGYVAACDIVLNLRYPTVGENSGTLMRALGLGKAVVVSEVGSFSELPETICLKAPVDASEEDHLFEYLNLLVSRPELRKALGARAREWVETECTWPKVARAICGLSGERIAGNGDGRDGARSTASPQAAPAEPAHANRGAVHVEPEYILSWAPDASAKALHRNAPHSFRENARDYAAWRSRRPYSRDGFVSANYARARKRDSVTVKCGAATTVPAGKVDQRSVQSSDGGAVPLRARTF